MADLIDRISGEAGQMVPPAPKINAHRWIGIQRLYAIGGLGWTRARVAQEFGFQAGADDTRQATQIADQIDAQSNLANKIVYIGKVEAIFYCLEDVNDTFYHTNGVVNKSVVFSHLGIVG